MDVTVDNPLKNDLKRRRQYVKHNIWPFRVPETLYEQPTYTALNSYIPLQSYTPGYLSVKTCASMAQR